MADINRLVCEQISERPLYWQMSGIIGAQLQRPSGWCCRAVEELMSRVFLRKYRLVFVDMEQSRLVDPGGEYDSAEVKQI